MKPYFVLLFFLYLNNSFSQSLKENDYLYFLGSYYEEDSSYQIGLYITVKEKDSLQLKIEIAKNWKTIGEKEFYFKLFLESSSKNKFKINHQKKKYPAFKFLNNEGLELFILKEGHNLAKLVIPPNLIFGVDMPKIFYQK